MSRRDTPPALRWTGYVGIAILFAIACGFLSNWQFSRNEERSVQLRLVEQNYDATPVALGDILPPDATLDGADEWRPVLLSGEYLVDEQLLVRNRAHGGSSAYEVLVPFRQDDGRVLLVDRGWLPPGQRQSEPDEIPAPPSGAVEIVVRLRPSEPVPASGRSAETGQVPTINLGLVSEQTGPLEQGAYGLIVSENPAPAAAPLAIDPPSDDPGPHLSYAIQWILFAGMGFAFIAYVIVSERRIRREDAEEARERGEEPEPTRERLDPVTAHRRRKRHRDRDAADEDALLDVH